MAVTGHTTTPGHEREHHITREHQVTHSDPGHGVCTHLFYNNETIKIESL